MKKIKLGQRGFSLLEMLMVVSLTTLAGYALFVSTKTAGDQNDTREARMQVQDSLREGIYKMVQELRQTGPTKISFSGGSSTSGTSISFSMPNPDSLTTGTGYAMNWTSAHTITYAFDSNNSRITRTDSTAGTAATIVANNVSAVTFTGDSSSPTYITIAITGQKTMANNRVVQTPLTAVAEVRNS